MKKGLATVASTLLTMSATMAQNDKIYICLKNGGIVEYAINEVDSLAFEKPISASQGESQGEMPKAQEYMAAVSATMTSKVPENVKTTNNGGRLENITYFSKTANKNKKAAVQLPPNYDKDKKYPVMYVNHGIFGDETSMQSEDNKIRTMANNMAATGEAKEMIIVYTAMYTSKTSNNCQGFNVEETKAYDAFLEDIAENLMPYVNSNYSTYTDRDHTAISGFSMGGRETLYIGLMRPDLFGYIGCACPAPGVTPAVDMYMSHPGNMQKSELKFKDGDPLPYVFLIVGGTNDGVVGNFPQEYHATLTSNNVDHQWIEIQGGGHDQSCIVPMYYNFIRSIFKTSDDFKK